MCRKAHTERLTNIGVDVRLPYGRSTACRMENLRPLGRGVFKGLQYFVAVVSKICTLTLTVLSGLCTTSYLNIFLIGAISPFESIRIILYFSISIS